jgi:hypothetical protein
MGKDKVIKWTNRSIAVHSMNERASDPAAIHAELQQVREKYGEITPEHALEFAKDKKTVLHTLLDWNDAQAGQKFRLLQLRYIIQNVEVQVISDGEEKTIAVSRIHTQQPEAEEAVRVALPDVSNLGVWALEKLDMVRKRLLETELFSEVVLYLNDAITVIQTKSRANGKTGSARDRLNTIVASKKFYFVTGKHVQPKEWKMEGDTILMQCNVKGGGTKIVKLEIEEIEEVFKN